MLVIRRAQLEALQADAARRLGERVAAHLARKYPMRWSALGERARPASDGAVRLALDAGLDDSALVFRFSELAFGSDVELGTRDSHGWVRELLYAGNAHTATTSSPSDSHGWVRELLYARELSGELRLDLLQEAFTERGIACRVLVNGARWYLLDADGRQLQSGTSHRGPLVVSSKADRFVTAPRSQGEVAFFDATTGELQSEEQTWAARMFEMSFLFFRGDGLFVAGEGAPGSPEQGMKRERSVAQLLRPSAEKNAVTLFEPASLVAASSDAGVVAALPGALVLLDEEARVSRGWALDPEITPVTLSVSGQRIHLVGATQAGAVLLLLSTKGALLARKPLPAPPAWPPVPPIVAPDGRFFIVTGQQVLAFSADAEEQWGARLARTHTASSAVVTPDGELLVTSGARVTAYDREGRGRVLADLGGRDLTSPVAIDAEGQLLVTDADSLFVLEPIERFEARKKGR